MQERSSKVIAIVALCVGVVGLSLGFAAFSASLTVSSSASVTLNEEESFILTTANATCVDQAGETVDGASATASGNSIAVTLPKAAFTAPGQSLTCTVDVTTPNYDANLTSVSGAALSCTPATGTANQGACSAIVVSVKHGATAVGTVTKDAGLSYNTAVPFSKGTDGTQTIEFKIDYPAGSQLPDGNLDVTIPTVTFAYDTI